MVTCTTGTMKQTPCAGCLANIAILEADQLECERRSFATKDPADRSLYVDQMIEIGDLIMQIEDNAADCANHAHLPVWNFDEA